jgi:hypothetical protein
MRKYIIFLTVLLWCMSIASVAEAHTGSGWSTWKPVTWPNGDYILAHHKHVERGTVCELIDRDGGKIRFLDTRQGLTNRDCTG